MQWRLIERHDVLRDPLSAANQLHHRRRRIFVEWTNDGTVGWGEVSPLEEAVIGDPSCDSVFHELAEVALLNVARITLREGVAPLWSRCSTIAGSTATSKWAYAAIEMALLDWELQRASISLAQYWNVDPASVETMATVSALDDEEGWQVSSSARRLRVKTSSGVNLDRCLGALRDLALPVLLDFNGSAGSSDEVLRQLSTLENHVELIAVEQPFTPADLIGHAELAQLTPVAVSLDESVRSVLDVRRIARYDAASLICVKPPRVGGVAVARSMLTSAHELGLRTYVGGFFESPLARSAHRCVAALVGSEPSDVAHVAVDSGALIESRPHGIGHYPRLSEQENRAAIVVQLEN
jgi:L-alanine-DL-glutamate epimerase-like enolase superfamily enzyme